MELEAHQDAIAHEAEERATEQQQRIEEMQRRIEELEVLPR